MKLKLEKQKDWILLAYSFQILEATHQHKISVNDRYVYRNNQTMHDVIVTGATTYRTHIEYPASGSRLTRLKCQTRVETSSPPTPLSSSPFTHSPDPHHTRLHSFVNGP
ncbi:hypothetical protein CBL_14518 [Carabus blaptoides fortunei]